MHIPTSYKLFFFSETSSKDLQMRKHAGDVDQSMEDMSKGVVYRDDQASNNYLQIKL